MERASGSPPIKDRTQRRPKPYHVHFDPTKSGTGLERSVLLGHTKPYSSGQRSDVMSSTKGGGEGGGKENEYLVEPQALNEVGADGMGTGGPRHVTRTSPLRSDLSRATTAAAVATTTTATSKPRRTLSARQAGETRTQTLPSTSAQRYDSSVRFTVPPAAVSTHLHPSPPSHSHSHTVTTSTASPSNPNNIGLPNPRPVSASAPYSNSTAVFGPPVKFGVQTKEMPPRQPTVVRPAEVNKIM